MRFLVNLIVSLFPFYAEIFVILSNLDHTCMLLWNKELGIVLFQINLLVCYFPLFGVLFPKSKLIY